MSNIPLPKIILPQSAYDATEDLSAFDIVYVREQVSYDLLAPHHPDVRLAPDMALALRVPPSQPTKQHGTFLRSDNEWHGRKGNDPIHLATTTDDYIRLAGDYESITTNRLHFAIAAALQGVRVSLTPNGYHKNESMYQQWLRRFANVRFRKGY